MARKCVSVLIIFGALFAILSFSSCESKRQNRYNPKDLIILKDSVTNLYYYADTNFRRVGELYTKAYAYQDKHAIVCLDTSYYVIDEEFRIVKGPVDGKSLQLKNDLLTYKKNDSVIIFYNCNNNLYKEFRGRFSVLWKDKVLIIVKPADDDYKQRYFYRICFSLYSVKQDSIIENNVENCASYIDNEWDCDFKPLNCWANMLDLDYVYFRKNGKAYFMDSNLISTNYQNAEYVFHSFGGFYPFVSNNKIGLMNEDFSLFLDAKFTRINDLTISSLLDTNNSNKKYFQENAVDLRELQFDTRKDIDGYFFVKDSQNSYIINSSSKTIQKCKYKIVESIGEGYFLALEDKKFFIIDYKGEKISDRTWNKYYYFERMLYVLNKERDSGDEIYNFLPKIRVPKPNGYDVKIIHSNGLHEIINGAKSIITDSQGKLLHSSVNSHLGIYPNPNIVYSYKYGLGNNDFAKRQEYLHSLITGERLKLYHVNSIHSFGFSEKTIQVVAPYDKFVAVLDNDAASIYDNYFHKVLSVPCDDLKFLRANIIEVTFKGKSRYYKL